MKLTERILKVLQDQKRRNAIKVTLFISWVLMIFVLSAIPSLLGGGDYYETLIRKLGHYFVFAMLLFFTYKVFRLSGRISFARGLAYAIIFSMVYAASDELHQLFVFGRHGSIVDFFIDGFGILTTSLFILLEHEHQDNYPQDRHFIKI